MNGMTRRTPSRPIDAASTLLATEPGSAAAAAAEEALAKTTERVVGNGLRWLLAHGGVGALRTSIDSWLEAARLAGAPIHPKRRRPGAPVRTRRSPQTGGSALLIRVSAEERALLDEAAHGSQMTAGWVRGVAVSAARAALGKEPRPLEHVATPPRRGLGRRTRTRSAGT